MSVTTTTPAVESLEGGVADVPGFRAHGVHAGLKRKRRDVAVIHSARADTACAAVFTTNRAAAAPVIVSRRVAATGHARAVVVNSACANACTGEQGMRDAERMAAVTADALGVRANEVIVCSTGIIGQNLPMDRVEAGIHACARGLDESAPGSVAEAIMTTDTRPKEILLRFRANGRAYHLGGVAKGSGMIHPNMATMLAFLATDAPVPAPALQAALSRVTDATFNMITVDGDTSTNDAVVALANGAGGGAALEEGTPGFAAFEAALADACERLAVAITADGEGATTVIEVRVTGAESVPDARAAARTIARSPLVKTAVHGRDPNWGRVIAALGASGAAFDPARVDLAVESGGKRLPIARAGRVVDDVDEAALSALMHPPHVVLHVDLHAGDADATAWGCDLSHAYVTINTDYRT